MHNLNMKTSKGCFVLFAKCIVQSAFQKPHMFLALSKCRKRCDIRYPEARNNLRFGNVCHASSRVSVLVCAFFFCYLWLQSQKWDPCVTYVVTVTSKHNYFWLVFGNTLCLLANGITYNLALLAQLCGALVPCLPHVHVAVKHANLVDKGTVASLWLHLVAYASHGVPTKILIPLMIVFTKM